MKKVFLSVVILAAVCTSVSSCKKTSTCTISGVKVEYSSKDYTAAQLDALKTSCIAAGGTWN